MTTMKMTLSRISAGLVLGALIAVTLSSCTDEFGALNTNPSLATEDIIRPDLLFTGVLKNSIFNIHENGRLSEFAYYYANQASGDIFANTNYGFSGDYQGDIINISETIRLTQDDPLEINKNAMARIWKVWLFHRLTDRFGDVPYSEAALSAVEAINQPVYDTQESIYRDMLNELRDAAADLSTDGSLLSYGSADILHGGDVEAWRRFANSLRLRLAMRVRYADQDLAEEHISEVINADLISENSQNASVVTEGESAADTDNRNPLYNRYERAAGYPMWCTFTTTDILKDLNDPRLPVYCLPATDGTSGYNGRPIQLLAGQKAPYSEDNSARLGELFWEPEYTIKVMTAAEVDFLEAEAFLAGLASGSAEMAYHDGIRHAMAMYDIPADEVDDYLASPAGNLTGGEEEQLEQIITQKWLALYFQSNEAWAEYRRTGYPLMWVGGEPGDTGGEIPRRLTYPAAEYSVNNENVTAAAQRMGGDELMTRVWWDAKAALPYDHPAQGTFPPN